MLQGEGNPTYNSYFRLGPKLVRLEPVYVERPNWGFEVTFRFEVKGLCGFPVVDGLLREPGELPG